MCPSTIYGQNFTSIIIKVSTESGDNSGVIGFVIQQSCSVLGNYILVVAEI